MLNITGCSRSESGFSMIELMIGLLIVGILSSVAIINYSSYTLRSHRTIAKTTLQHYSALQERFFSRNNTYAATLAALNVEATTEDDRYNITLATMDSFDTSYSITATATGAQVKDDDCLTFTIDSLGRTTATAGAGGSADNCW